MIKINLLPSERRSVKKKAAFNIGQQVTAACAGILILAGSTVGWRLWLLRRDAAQMEAAVDEAQRETTRLHTVILQMQEFEQRKSQLQQRVSLIEQLRQDQVGPVHMLDQISLSLPDLVWLTEIKQSGSPSEVLIDGKSLALTGLSDFVANLERSGYFQRSVEIVASTTETGSGPQPEVVKFQIKAVFKAPADGATTTARVKEPSGQLKPKG